MVTPVCSQVAQRIGTASITQILVPFVSFDYETGARKRFLWCAALARDSCFKKFTFAGNGMEGNIGPCEDILDRIMSFV